MGEMGSVGGLVYRPPHVAIRRLNPIGRRFANSEYLKHGINSKKPLVRKEYYVGGSVIRQSSGWLGKASGRPTMLKMAKRPQESEYFLHAAAPDAPTWPHRGPKEAKNSISPLESEYFRKILSLHFWLPYPTPRPGHSGGPRKLKMA